MYHTIQFYDHGRHYDKLCNWLGRYDLPKPNKELMSDVGLIINDCAIGFLFKTNSKMAWIDNVATNPTRKSLERHESLNLLLKNLDSLARRSGFKAVQILSNTEDMEKRLYELGYLKHGAYSLMYKETGGT